MRDPVEIYLYGPESIAIQKGVKICMNFWYVIKHLEYFHAEIQME